MDIFDNKMKLTNRETQILILITKGYLNKEIAKELSISVRTVHTHLRKIYLKLCARNRSNAVTNFLREIIKEKLVDK